MIQQAVFSPGTLTDTKTLTDADWRDLTSTADADLSAAEFHPTPELIQREITEVLQKKLSPEFQYWVGRYTEVGRRSAYLWGWCRQAVEITTLPCVAAELREELCDTKALGVMLDVFLDDVADHSGDSDLLDELLKLFSPNEQPDFSRFPRADQAYAVATAELWREIQRRARRYPRYEQYADLLRFDYLQLANVMRYSQLINSDPALMNLVEHDLYTPQNMHIMLCSTLDLMCSPAFDHDELGKLREVVWHAQCMGRIGNLTTTWQRELHENDFSSGVYARALMAGDVTLGQLDHGPRDAIAAAIQNGGHEAFFLERWQEHRRFLLSRRSDLQSVDVAAYLRGFQRLICIHLGSRGYK